MFNIFNGSDIYYYEHDMIDSEFKKIKTDKININKSSSDLTVNVNNLSKLVDELDSFYSDIVNRRTKQLNDDLSKLTVTLEKLEKKINKDYAGSVDIKDKLKEISKLTGFSTEVTTSIYNDVDNIISLTSILIKNILK